MDALNAEVVWLALGHNTVPEEHARPSCLAIEGIVTMSPEHVWVAKRGHGWWVHGSQGRGRCHGWKEWRAGSPDSRREQVWEAGCPVREEDVQDGRPWQLHARRQLRAGA